MVIHRKTCPRCGTKNVALEEIGLNLPGGDVVLQFEHPRFGRCVDVLVRCAYCQRGVVFTFEINRGGRGRLREIAPSPPRTVAPEHTPQNVDQFFRQGMENLPGNWDAAGAMFRKALDTALKHKFPDLRGRLFERIENAAGQHKLTPDLANWAHQIRLGGNDASHEEAPFSKDAAEELASFTKLVLLYLFTLPGMLEKSRIRPESSNDSAP